jgi:hypothetical protein
VGREAPNAIKHAVVARGRQGRCARRGGPEDGPSLTASVRAGMRRVQVGAEGWCRSNKRMGLPDTVPARRVREAEVPDSSAKITVMKKISFRSILIRAFILLAKFNVTIRDFFVYSWCRAMFWASSMMETHPGSHKP